jgi:arylsulfatase A-like enzyme
LLLACDRQQTPEPTTPEPPVYPDLILVTFDTTRADSVDLDSSDGTHTPTLAALAETGIQFTHVWSPSPLTLPSHATLLTGDGPLRHQARNNGSYRLVSSAQTLAESLSAAGYSTGAVIAGLPLIRSSGMAQGFDHYDDNLSGWMDELGRFYPERTAQEVNEAALAVWAEMESSPRLLWVHYFDPHLPLIAPSPWSEQHADPYYAELAYADHHLSTLLSGLGDSPDGRMVIVTSDHGESQGSHGEDTHGLFVHDATTRVPLIVSWPGVLPEGRTVSGDARLMDITPTIYDLLGLPSSAQGESLRPHWESDSPPETRVVYGESLFPMENLGMEAVLAIREGDLRLVRTTQDRLFDLSSDPGEETDIADQQPAETERMAALLAQWQKDNLRSVDADVDMSAETVDQLEALGYVSAGMTGSERLDIYQHVGLAKALGTTPTDEAALEQVLANIATLLEEYPAAEGGWEYLVRLSLRKSNDMARTHAERAIVLHEDNTYIMAILAMTSQDRTVANDMIDKIMHIIKSANENEERAAPRTLSIASSIAQQLGRDQDALIMLDTMSSHIHRYPDQARDRATLRHTARRFEEAVDDYTIVLNKTPEDAEVWRNKSYALASLSRFDEAIAAMDRSLALQPEQPQLKERRAALQQHISEMP